MRALLYLTTVLALPTAALAETPRVVTDIGPVHSLVAMVMEGAGTPDRLLAPGASPHEMALRPSQARTLSEADLVVWIGPELTPQLQRQIETLAPAARSLPLDQVPGTHLLPARDTGIFAHDHGDDHDDQDNHADHDDHDDHGPKDEDHAHDDQDEHDDHADADEHHDGDHDPHLWLDPENALLWLNAIAAALSVADPDQAALYSANADKGAAAIAAARAQAMELLIPVSETTLGVGHDAFQYFEDSFGLTVTGALSDSDASAPGPARIAALRDSFAEQPPACILTEVGTDTGLLNAIGAADIPLAELDQLGTTLPQGASLYPAILLDLANRIATCTQK